MENETKTIEIERKTVINVCRHQFLPIKPYEVEIKGQKTYFCCEKGFKKSLEDFNKHLAFNNKVNDEAEKYISEQEFNNIFEDDKIFAAFIAGINFAQRWIAVEEELPTEYGKYIIKGKSEVPYLSWFNPETKLWSSLCKITHWRPISIGE